jgi:hypothetical protein
MRRIRQDWVDKYGHPVLQGRLLQGR